MSSRQVSKTTASAKRDYRQEVTDSIVKMLEDGVAPWQKPWESAGMPMNPTSGREYRGGNAIHLMATGMAQGYDDPRWMTYKQAAENEWQVRQGEKGTHIEFWDVKSKSESRGDSSGATNSGPEDEKTDRRLIHRVYTVFNAKQIDGVPSYERPERTGFEAIQSGECILANSGANIAHDQRDSAFYNRKSDSIHLPPKELFNDAAGYYGTALHELAHWTGHPSRLNRATLNDTYRFGDLNYAKEELRAELASVFIAAEVGVPHEPANRWEAVNTRFGDLSLPLQDYFAAQWIQQTTTASSARVLIFPETVVPRWSEATAEFWRETLDRCKLRGQILAMGAGVPRPLVTPVLKNPDQLDLAAAIRTLQSGPSNPIRAPLTEPADEFDNTLMLLGAESATLNQRIPVPIGMWQPFRKRSVPLHLGSPGVISIDGQRAAVLICYEQLLPYPVLASVMQKPTVLIGISNMHWFAKTTLPRYQSSAMRAWARLFHLPYFLAVNF